MEKVYCKRCGKELTAKKSKEIGFGNICYRLQQQETKLTSNNEIMNTLNFLKCEITMIKNQLKAVKTNGISTINPIERIKQTNTIIESKDLNNMNDVITEMKELFVRVSNVRELLIHVEVV